MNNRNLLLAATILIAAVQPSLAASAKVGLLSCDVLKGVAFIVEQK
ncbi:hypothetical protein [Antarcticirhabdus aurantiaca]|uniref:Uncharacterized protein n=1 Tax=Antarcticirhabdus aurantiaca TaxID=2606717 RepID=A0ACD4NRC1_9HYPH|nr:hypothetical protein OXU80_04275 [Jeongeuplla avenae]